MNEVLTKKLLDDFPRLFRNRHESSLERDEFVCGDGWFDLIYKLSLDIEIVAQENGLRSDSPDWPRCRQVKEKFGSLRFVVFASKKYPNMSERINALICAAFAQSLRICECCGQSGITVTDGCIAYRCKKYAQHDSNKL